MWTTNPNDVIESLDGDGSCHRSHRTQYGPVKRGFDIDDSAASGAVNMDKRIIKRCFFCRRNTKFCLLCYYSAISKGLKD